LPVFRNKADRSYTPLELPGWRNYPIPTASINVADATAGAKIADSVHDTINELGLEGLESQYPALRSLHLQLLENFAVNRDEPPASIDQSLSYSLMVGWLFGQRENESGLMKPGMKGATYWVSMSTLWAITPRAIDPRFDDESLFALWAAYYVSRTGDESISLIVRRLPGYWQSHPGPIN